MPSLKSAPRQGVKSPAAPNAKKMPPTSKSPRSGAGKPLAKTAASARKMPAPKIIKEVKPKKDKLVRDSFTIPKSEYSVIDDLKQRVAKLGKPAKKSELLRAGIKALARMADTELTAALGQVPAIKTGRPGKA